MRHPKILVEYFVPVISCLTISLGLAKLITSSSIFKISPTTSTGNIIEQFIWTSSITIAGLIGVTCFYWLISRNRGNQARVIVALVVAPTLAISLIVLSQTVLMIVSKIVSSLFASITILVSLYSAIFSVIFIITDVFSTRVRNFIFILYGALLGSFIGLLLPTVSLIVLLSAVAVYDLLMLNSSWAFKIFNKGSSREEISKFSYVGDSLDIGLGEFIFYSFLPAHVEAYFGNELLILTLAMIMIGIFLNIRIMNKREFMSGLPVPIFLGLMPVVFRLFF